MDLVLRRERCDRRPGKITPGVCGKNRRSRMDPRTCIP